jgi:hypothetical protein
LPPMAEHLSQQFSEVSENTYSNLVLKISKFIHASEEG